ncbi:MAG: ribosome small subunit-dependent GTPase A [Bacteriovoracaceae bacterium]|nr:ribosome small subunit-dependent GTPase A [Bacteriovoracaceae bacterium]
MKARVYRSHQRSFDCRLENSNEIVKATAYGKLLKGEETIVVGDYVTLEENVEGEDFLIVERDKRKSEIFRILVRESKKKVTAANCDLLVILNSVSKPAFKRGIIDRFLVRAHQWQVKPIVIFNKMDEHDPEKVDLEYERDRLQKLGVECFEICALDMDYKSKFLENGIVELKKTLEGKTSLFVGQSGVGKSQTIQCLGEGEFELRTKKVGKGGKGSHTTTWSEIIDCGNFELIDSPGIRSFSIDDIDPEELMSYFPDLEETAVQCKFNNCEHYPDNPGCKFHENVDENSREYDLLLSRLESYVQMHTEACQTPHWEKSYKKS